MQCHLEIFVSTKEKKILTLDILEVLRKMIQNMSPKMQHF